MWAEAEHEYKYELKLKKNYLEMLTCWAMGKSPTRLQKFISENLDFFFNAAVLIVNEIQKNRNRTIQLRFPKHYQAGWLSMKQTRPLLMIKNTKHL